MPETQIEVQIAKLKHNAGSVRRSAANALGQLRDPSAVPAIIEAFQDEEWTVCRAAADALGSVGAPAMPALIEALTDENEQVMLWAAEALGKIDDASAVLALIEALKDKNEHVRALAAFVLGKTGDASAVPALIEASKDRDKAVQRSSAKALWKLGDSYTLPRIILADSRWSAQERIDILESLRRVRYDGSDSDWSKISLRYEFPEPRTLCQAVLNETNAEARHGAQIVLNWLDGDRHLLRSSHPDTSKQSEELLRAAQGGEPEMSPTTLLRAGPEPGKKEETVPAKPTVWNRLFGKRNGAAS